ncbi:MAG: hypothetical protein SWE60_05880, partial [Thermodesulfobacteriota bacterium]|nr:hypothetical protein [Thermodesulfobacteriota bacterium]
PKSIDDVPDEIVIRLKDFKSCLSTTRHERAAIRELWLTDIKAALNRWEDVAERLSVTEKERRRQLNYHDVYLKVWDLREEGRKWTEIAKEVYSNDLAPDSAYKKVRQHYDRACELIREAPSLDDTHFEDIDTADFDIRDKWKLKKLFQYLKGEE